MGDTKEASTLAPWLAVLLHPGDKLSHNLRVPNNSKMLQTMRHQPRSSNTNMAIARMAKRTERLMHRVLRFFGGGAHTGTKHSTPAYG